MWFVAPDGTADVTLAAAVDPVLYPTISVTAEDGDGDPAPGTEVLAGAAAETASARAQRRSPGGACSHADRRRQGPGRLASSSCAWRRAPASPGAAPSMRHSSATSSSPSTGSIRVVARPASSRPFTRR